MITTESPRRAAVGPSAIATCLDVRVDTVRQWISDGRLRAIDIGDGKGRPTWRVTLDALRAFLTERGMTTAEILSVIESLATSDNHR